MIVTEIVKEDKEKGKAAKTPSAQMRKHKARQCSITVTPEGKRNSL